MPNQTFALDWLDKAKRNLETASLLFRYDHYTDIIAVEIHQTLEKTFKALYAYYGIPIPRTHNLMPLYEFAVEKIEIPGITIDDILVISDYYESDRYPGPKYFIPSKEEIARNITIAGSIFEKLVVHINTE